MCAPLRKLYPLNNLNQSLQHCDVNKRSDKADSIKAQNSVTFKTFSPFKSCLQIQLLFYFNIPQSLMWASFRDLAENIVKCWLHFRNLPKAAPRDQSSGSCSQAQQHSGLPMLLPCTNTLGPHPLSIFSSPGFSYIRCTIYIWLGFRPVVHLYNPNWIHLTFIKMSKIISNMKWTRRKRSDGHINRS